MNILFVLYHDFTCNSASHVHNFANELTKLGHNCAVAVPFNKESIDNLSLARYRAVEFEEVLGRDFAFPDGRGPDVLHAWTPREVVRRFCMELKSRYDCSLFVHMEDNEWHLLATALGFTWEQIFLLHDSEIEQRMRPHISHPRKGPELLSSAHGITVIIDRLQELVPRQVPILELWPSADPELFKRLPKHQHERQSLGIPVNSAVLVYTGNVHPNNAHEMRSLYLAVAVLNREGTPVTLVRAGKDFCPFLGPQEQYARRHSIELGSIPHREVPRLLALADVLVQPGRSDPFNDYRFPSKLPEFLSAGRPVILPNANLAKHMIHLRHAFIVPDGSALPIADAVRRVINDPGLSEGLSNGATEFFNEHFSWTRRAQELSRFYGTNQSRRFAPVAWEPWQCKPL